MLKKILLFKCILIITISGCAEEVTSNENSQEENNQYKNSILIKSQRDIENFEIYTMTENGENVQRITDNKFNEGSGVFSPDKEHIAFESYADDDNQYIYTVDKNGQNLKKLTNSQYTDKNPDWSSTGKIAYSNWSGQFGGFKIFKIDTSGSNKVELAHVDATYPEYSIDSPHWSPDGSKIAYIKRGNPYRDGQNVYIMKSDGSEKFRLTEDSTTAHEYFNPQWVSESEISVYDSNDQGDPQIIKFDIESGEKEIIQTPDNAGSFYAWSPDYTKIAYSKYVLGTNGEDGSIEIFIYNLENDTEKQITDSKGRDWVLDWK